MTAKEMLKIIDEIHDYPCPYGIGGTAWIEIRNCIEKQIPKKPVIEKEQTIFGIICGKCPECEAKIYSSTNRFCHKCGQALDWSEENA